MGSPGTGVFVGVFVGPPGVFVGGGGSGVLVGPWAGVLVGPPAQSTPEVLTAAPPLMPHPVSVCNRSTCTLPQGNEGKLPVFSVIPYAKAGFAEVGSVMIFPCPKPLELSKSGVLSSHELFSGSLGFCASKQWKYRPLK